MKQLTITRFAKTPYGIFGQYRTEQGLQHYTLEPFNHIPADVYLCKPDRYNKGGYNASEVQNVTGRTEILHHVGNTILDTQGCILHGSWLGYIEGRWAITNSRTAFDIFMIEYGSSDFTLDLRENY